jgi:trehalose 6-phosphate synthase/phosphatase
VTLRTSLKFQTTRPDPQPAIRLQRKESRSSSRPRYPTISRSYSYSNGNLESYYFAPNSHCNGGLKNAVDSVKDRMTNKLWVGTLGNSTDAFSSDLRANIDSRMWDMHSSRPVWIPDAEFESCYDEFCHQVTCFTCLSFLLSHTNSDP